MPTTLDPATSSAATTSAAPADTPAVRPPARWAVRTARLAALTAVPSGLWRLALGVGIPVGFSGTMEARMTAHMPGWGTLYVIVLSALAEALAFLTLGLVRPWGQLPPRRLPFVGGRRIAPRTAATAAALGAVAVTLITTYGATTWYDGEAMGNPEAPQGLAGFLMTACYAPLLLWGPLLAVVTADFRRRARAASC
ncbi:hypothetical protein ACIRBX_29055 [Kitasatospora sp. NPDC096147]|uniref:hypothetical protein n=1 Tax=Kitasatospora sp. NPDC096147 TaxID=3364093 RepID=UPI0037FBA7F6